MGKNPDAGINIQDHISESLVTIVADLESGAFLTLDPG
jgi:hypothetical protein